MKAMSFTSTCIYKTWMSSCIIITVRSNGIKHQNETLSLKKNAVFFFPASTRRGTDVIFMLVRHVEIMW